jgi:hypothetical protein
VYTKKYFFLTFVLFLFTCLKDMAFNEANESFKLAMKEIPLALKIHVHVLYWTVLKCIVKDCIVWICSGYIKLRVHKKILFFNFCVVFVYMSILYFFFFYFFCVFFSGLIFFIFFNYKGHKLDITWSISIFIYM